VPSNARALRVIQSIAPPWLREPIRLLVIPAPVELGRAFFVVPLVIRVVGPVGSLGLGPDVRGAHLGLHRQHST
jgi:hypothetical protein